MKKEIEINLREIEKKIGYTFKDKSLLMQAFTRTSFCNEINPTVNTKYYSNEVLEFFGDGVLSLSIITFLLKECTERYEHGIKTELGEGDFSNIKSKLSDKQNLSKSMKALGLEKHLLMGEGDKKLGIQNEPSVMEDLFESIVGAIFIDSGMNINSVIAAVSGMLDMSVYTDRQKISQSAKNALQEWCADKKRRLPAPRYETLSEDGPDHKKTYVRGCYIGDKLMGRGIGKNFKIADSEAAEDALKALVAESEHEAKKADAKAQSEAVKVKEAAKPKEKAEPTKPKEIKATKESAGVKQAQTAKKPESVSKEAKANEAILISNKKQGGATVTLKSYATSNKKPTPTFRDLGERRSGNKVECAVECSFLGESALGIGATRLEAREAASQLMVEKLGIGKKKKASESKSAKAAMSSELPQVKQAARVVNSAPAQVKKAADTKTKDIAQEKTTATKQPTSAKQKAKKNVSMSKVKKSASHNQQKKAPAPKKKTTAQS